MSERVVSAEPERVSYLRRFGTRFLALYILLSFFPAPLNVVPLLGDALAEVVGWWLSAVAWIGEHVFRLAPVPIPESSCGDFLIQYVQVAVTGLVAGLGGLAWAMRQSRAEHEQQLWAALRVYARFVLGFTMLNYGVVKVFPIQFSDLGPHSLETTAGDTRLMALYWTAMSASPLYGFFGGAAEVAGGVLVLFRRTALLGALVIIGVMSNVVALNFGFDICVKVFSSHVLLLAVFLAAPDLPWLMRTLTSRWDDPAYRSGRARRVALAIKLALIACALTVSVQSVLEAYRNGRVGPPKSPLYGAWNVVAFDREGVAVPACESEHERWRLVLIEGQAFSAKTTDGKRLRYKYSYDEKSRVLDLTNRKTNTQLKLRVSGSAPNLILEDASGALRMTLKLKPQSDYALLEDRIDMINETL